jgi:site-specific DNA-methyltransferase (adenine-specific)
VAAERDIVTIGGATLILGDCRDVLPALSPIDSVITDPPYGVRLGKCGDRRGGSHGMRHSGYSAGIADTYEAFVSEIVPRINQALDLAPRALVWTGPHIHEQRKPTTIGGVLHPAATGRHAWGFRNLLPCLLYGASPTVAKRKGAFHPTAIVSCERSEKNGHPVPKPIGWMLWAVRLASLPGDMVLDPFMGSGTTGVACAQLGRRLIGIEIEPKWFDLACQRIEAAQGAAAAA